MEKTVTMPKLGMTMEEGEVLNWRYKEGDRVEKGEPLVEIMTDKVNIEFEAPFDGQLVHILAKDGDVLPVGSPIAVMSDGKEEVVPVLISVPANTSAEQYTERERLVSLPDVNGMNLSSPQHTVPSTPAAKRAAANYGIDLQAVEQSGAKLPLHLADITAFIQQKSQANGLTTAPIAASIATTNGIVSPQLPVRATPVAQKIAKEHQVDLAVIAENKVGGKVTRADVEAHLVEKIQTKPQQAVSVPVTISEQATTESEIIPISGTRRLIGQRMVQSITTAPHIYLDVEIDMSEAERCRQRIGRNAQAKGLPVPSITALLVQATAKALLLHRDVNATLESGGPQGKEVIRRWHNVHIGIAVDTERTLLTPVIRNAHHQSLQEIAQSLRSITLAAREGTLKPDDLVGATFTISNLGMYGINTFHAIIAPGQSAILAVGKITKQPVVVEDGDMERIEIRPIMKVSLSADHRVLDGASGSRFLFQLKTFLEDPYLML